jgi:hypothetical protein
MQKINDILKDLENVKEPFTERKVSKIIQEKMQCKDGSNPPTKILAEYIAFDYCETLSEDGSVWGTYYGPLLTTPNENDTINEYPSIKKVNKEILEYWFKRAKESKHPILKARYSSLVWDFSKKVTNKSANIEMAHIWIDNVIEIAKRGCHRNESNVVQKLKKVLSIAISINDNIRINNVKNIILKYDLEILEKLKRGPRGFSFDTLLMNKKVKLNEKEKYDIINSLEGRLELVVDYSNKKLFDPHVAKDYAVQLAYYYRKIDKHEDMKRVLLKYGNAFKLISRDASGLLAISWLQSVEAVYRNFGLNLEAEKLLNEIRIRGPEAKNDMKTIKIKKEISQEEMKEYVDAILKDDIDEATTYFAYHFIPKEIEVAEQIAIQYHFYFLQPFKIITGEQ